jgi:hypothetical protein
MFVSHRKSGESLESHELVSSYDGIHGTMLGRPTASKRHAGVAGVGIPMVWLKSIVASGFGGNHGYAFDLLPRVVDFG